MSTPRKKRDPKPAVPVVRREPAARTRLSPELEAFARSEGMRIPRTPRPTTPRLADPRDTGLVPGVANRDARIVADSRISELERLVANRAESGTEELERALAEAIALGIWRGRSVTSFEAFAEHLLGLDPEEAVALAERGRERLGLGEGRGNEAAIAVWVRTEAALREAGFAGRATIRNERGALSIVVELPVQHAPEGLELIGRRMAPLARDRRQQGR